MRAVDLILKKRQGHSLTQQEIFELIQGYTRGDVPDYQMAAWAMAVFFQGMTAEETSHLTMAMVHSGDVVDLSRVSGIKVDKHSTGGVGDTTTLVLGPLVASIGVPVAKMSGRGLGHTGGTIDKLESIPGFSVEFTIEEFVDRVNRCGISVMGQTARLTPADKKLYGLRDVTATVESIPLIASSIMSKKIAAGADAIVLDVKTGNGAFMREQEDAVRLAKAMVDIGSQVGRKTVAIVSDMSQPLSNSIGNALEVKEAIETLKGNGSHDLTELCLTLGSHMAVLAGVVREEQEGRALLQESLASGKAIDKFREFVRIHSGDERVADDTSRLPQANEQIQVKAAASGFVASIEALELGTCAMLLGAGRATKDSSIDLAVGIQIHRRIGETVQAGEPLATLYVNQKDRLEEVEQRVQAAFSISSEPVAAPKLIRDIIR